MEKLTPKQKAFADYYIELGNATEAAIKAGYSKKTAYSIGNENLKKPEIKKYIQERVAEKEEKMIAKQDEVLKFLTSVLRGEITEEIPIGKGEGFFQLEDKTPSVKDRVKAAELLGKRYAMWTDKQQVEGSQQVIFVEDLDE
ncbi:terminase small subunit [Weizmannia sp. FSL W8-0676]|uniref:terminase small subunit n=1 Tax=Weizmannia sp. FSL W8-0676 TaxID=2954703 RepID=UPI003158EFB2